MTEINVESRERSDGEMALLMGVENLPQRSNNTGGMIDAVEAQAYLAAVNGLTGTDQSDMTPNNHAKFLKEGPGRDAILERIRHIEH